MSFQNFLHVDLLVLTARPESAAAPAAVDDSALVNAAASAYFLRASADPEHRVRTPEHYDRDYPFLSLPQTCHPFLSNCSLLFSL